MRHVAVPRARVIAATAALAVIMLTLTAPLALPAAAAAASAGSSSAAHAPRATIVGGATYSGFHGVSSATARTSSVDTTASTDPNAPIPVSDSDLPLPGRHLSANRVLAIAAPLPKMRRERAKYRGTYGGAYLKGPGRWQVSYFTPRGKEIGQVIIDDATGRVLEQWTGFQIPWGMARGYPGAFGRHADALYVWLGLTVLFVLPFINPRRWRSMLHLDLLAVSFFSVSVAFFNHANIGMSTPLVYPPLVYLLVRMLVIARAGRHNQPDRLLEPPPLKLLFPVAWLAVAAIFLVGFRVGLNVTDSNVIDVGYASVVGADRIVHGQKLYGNWPANIDHGDTYGPVNYEAYIPFAQAFGFSGRWDDLPAAHAASVAFDLLAAALLFLLGRRVRGPNLGVVLAYAWLANPFTLFTANSNSNDTLVCVLVLGALLAADWPVRRGVMTALAGLSKFAPLGLAPLMGTHGLRGLPRRRQVAALLAFTFAFIATALLFSIPALTHDSLSTIYERTIAYQGNRGSPFSIWGFYGWGTAQAIVQGAAVALAILIALVPRRPDVVGLAAASAAVLIGLQLGIDHWFYLYIPWFLGAALLAVFGRFGEPAPSASPVVASTPARSRPLAAA